MAHGSQLKNYIMPNLFALIVGIDNYPTPLPALDGCVNDATAFSNYLSDWCKANSYTYKVQTLFNEQALRENVTNAFSVFNAATDADTCVLYYSGHGSQQKAPVEFWDEADGLSETLVCIDSRNAGNRDLIDKELTYLIGKATKGKRNQFIVVMDCCHSGSNTRDMATKSRKADTSQYIPRGVSDFMGSSEYINFQPPGARHIHFAAAKDNETAKEYPINNVQRGVFTYSLIEVLTETGGKISHKELIQRVRQRVQFRVNEQMPSMDTYVNESDANNRFLTNTPINSSFVVSKLKNVGWAINAGEILGVGKDTIFEIPSLSKTFSPTTIKGSYSTISGLDTLDPSKQFSANVKSWSSSTFKNKKRSIFLDTDPSGDLKALATFKTVAANSQLISFVSDIKLADYVVRSYEGSFRLTTVTSNIPLFRRVTGSDNNAAIQFLSDVETVLNWRNKIEVNNALSNFSDTDLKITFCDANSNPTPNATYKQVDAATNVTMQVSVTNTGTKPLYVSGLYFSSDFSITNMLMPNQFLAAGQTAWLQYNNKRDIPLYVPKEFQSWGTKTIVEHLKFFVSADALTTDGQNQDGLQLDMRTPQTTRAIGSIQALPSLNLGDWRTYDADFTTVCP